MLLIEADAHTLTPVAVGYCFISALDKEMTSLCAPTCCTVFLPINFLPVFTVFASLKHSCFQRGQESGQLCFQPLASLVDRISGFHPGCPSSIPEQRIKISLLAITHCCLYEITFLTIYISCDFFVENWTFKII